MARTEHNELKAGIFTLVALGAGVAVLVWLGATDFLRPAKGKAYFYVSESAGSLGLTEGGLLLLNDAVVGKIVEIRNDAANRRTLYIARIDEPGREVYANGKATVAAGMLGAIGVAVTDRGSGPQLADEGHAIEISPSQLDQVMEELAGVGETLNDIATTLDNEMDAENKGAVLAKLHQVIDQLNLTASRAAVIAGNILAQTDVKDEESMLAKAYRTLTNVSDITADAKPKIAASLTSAQKIAAAMEGYVEKDVAGMLADLRTSNTELVKMVTNFRILSAKAKDVVVLNAEHLDETILNFKMMSANLNAAAKEIRRNPWRLLDKPKGERQLHSKDIYDAARSFSEGAAELDDALTRLVALRKAHPAGVTAKDPELKKVLAHITKSFEKFRTVEDALWKELQK